MSKVSRDRVSDDIVDFRVNVVSECADGDMESRRRRRTKDRGEEEEAWEASGDSGATVE